jgi:hypothetical protein
MTVENPGAAEVEVDMATLKASLACPLCDDMYRFPVTVMECLHTFCHACIVKVVQPGKPSNACPKCQIGLGVNPFVEKKIVRDGTKTSIVDRLREGGHFGGVDVTEGTGVGGE